MYYVYDWKRKIVLQAEDYINESGQEVLIKDGVYHLYTTRNLLGTSIKEAVEKAAVYCQKQLEFEKELLARVQKQRDYWLAISLNVELELLRL